MRSPFVRWFAALLAAVMLSSAPAYMESDVDFLASDAIDDAIEEWDAELEDALDEPTEAAAFDLEADAPSVEQDENASGLTGFPEGTLGERDALFEGYVERLFYPQSGHFEARNLGGDLSGDARGLYDFLRERIGEVAAGQRASTQFTYSQRGSLTIAMAVDILYRLIADCPYETYWFGDFYEVTIYGNSITVSITVSSGYALDEYTANTATAAAASLAANNARAIVARHAGKSDYDKLAAYRDEICAAVSYNHDAASSLWPSNHMDPWQLIWVFDNNPDTEVVCEGYAKAFQYLCDLSAFSGSVMCYSVTGYSDGEAHKWNIVRMPNGRNYLVDVTFCDQEGSGTYDWLFMKAPESGNSTDGYSFTVRNGSLIFSATYVYDSETLSLFAPADLNLSIGAYLDEAGLSPLTANLDFTVDLPTDDAPVTATTAAATPTIAAVKKNGRVTVTAAPGTVYQLDPGGAAATRFKSSNKKVATVSSAGLVTVRKAGKTKLSFKALGKTRTVTLTVKDPTIPKKVTLNAPAAVKAGDVITLSPAIPAGAYTGFTWRSSNKRVATVKNGVVTFKKKGRVTITCTARRGGKKARATFRVAAR